MNRHLFTYWIVAALFCSAVAQQVPVTSSTTEENEEPPEGYYAFVESPNATPPRVRPPPYRQSNAECAGSGARPHVSAHNLCGDLNRGLIPRNPLGQLPAGEPYPFELIRNETLRFLSRTLPVLRADDALPRVAHVAAPPQQNHQQQYHHQHAHYPQPSDLPELAGNRLEDRMKRSTETKLRADEAEESSRLPAEHRAAASPREARKFCDGGGVFCMLYRAINGDSSAGPERREDPGAPPPPPPRYEGPPTPCPARVEYATPVFARNYQGVWRYVVQIPYEGYFTQTVEVTRCMQSRCHYLEGGCLSSPRWLSLLVAELHHQPPHSPEEAVDSSSEKSVHCDANVSLGCYQVRLYYDWFLVPGSCKCWRPDYFARYVRRNEL